MSKKIIWLVASCLMVAALVLGSCAPAPVVEEEEEKKPVVEEKKPVVEEKKPVVEEKAEMVKIRLTKLDGTVVEKSKEKPRYGGELRMLAMTYTYFDEPNAIWHSYPMAQTHEELLTGNWARGPAGTNEFTWQNQYWVSLESETGALAESWEIPDHETIIFHIRKGVHFALNPESEASRLVNGRELTADDVVFSFKDLWASHGYGKRRWPECEPISITAPDKWTVVLKLPPEASGPAIEMNGDFLHIVPHEVVEKYGDMRDWENSVGTGAFMVTDVVYESSATFERNPNYWGKDPLFPENQLPYLDRVKFLWIRDVSTQGAALRTGKLDLMCRPRVDWETAAQLMKSNPELKYKKVSVSSDYSTALRNGGPPFNDVRVRRALAMAINQQEIIDHYYGGNADILTWVIPNLEEFKAMYTPFDELPEETRKLYEYHPDEAKQLLAEAGYPDGFTVVGHAQTGDLADYFSLLKAYWEKIGVNLEIKVYESTALRSLMTGGEWSGIGRTGMAVGGHFSGISSYTHPDSLINYANVNDPRLNELREQINAAWFDAPKRFQLMKEFNVYFNGQAYYIQQPLPDAYAMWHPWIKGYSGEQCVGHSNFFNFSYWIWCDQDLKEEMTGKR